MAAEAEFVAAYWTARAETETEPVWERAAKAQAAEFEAEAAEFARVCLLYTSPSPRDS